MRLCVKAVLLDIEGTTTSLSFVRDTLLPYAEQNAAAFLRTNWNEKECKDAVSQLMQLEDDTQQQANVIGRFEVEMKTNPKSLSVKQLQGMIWKRGYDNGELVGHVYSDVPEALQLWKDRGISIWIYSSGSVESQKLLFEHSEFGSLLGFIDGHFDTNIGSKTEPGSYTAISSALQLKPQEILFFTDIQQEADAAGSAGLKTAVVVRDESPTEHKTPGHPVVSDFSSVELVCNTERTS